MVLHKLNGHPVFPITKSDALRELEEAANNRRLKEEQLLPKDEEGLPRRKTSTDTDVTKEYKRIVSKESERQ